MGPSSNFRFSSFELRFSSFPLGAGLDAFEDLLSAELRQMKKARTMNNFFERGNQQFGVGQTLVVEFNLDL